jgi:hypothetical protein
MNYRDKPTSERKLLRKVNKDSMNMKMIQI